jgi:hypothetical protein
LSQELQTVARAESIYTAFREMAQDALQAAEEASCQAREERIAAVGALPLTGLQVPGAPAVLEPSEQFESDCREGVQALAEEILKRGSDGAAAARRAAREAQRQGEETRRRASQASTQPDTMPPPPAPTRTIALATPAGQQPTRGAEGSAPGPAAVARSKPRRPQGLGLPPRPARPAPVTRSVERVEFNAQMSH